MKMQFQVSGMTCDHCAKSLGAALSAVEGVTDSQVSLADARARVTMDEAVCSAQQVVEAIHSAGFGVTGFSPTD